jgi:exportin-5|tara:strand:+ start:297 stop:1355 length:1059 start_codon:yes stop_codon:yes gene_type:complete
MHERLAAAWDRGRKNSQNDENPFASDMDGEDLSFAAAALAGGGAAAVAELVADRVTRDLTRDHCALLELLAAPEGTFGRKTKGSGLTGHLRHLSGNSTSQDGSQSQNETVSPFEKLAHGGGRHVLGWMAATAVAEGNVGGDRCCRAALGTACAAITWGDSEASGKALGFLRGVVAAAAASGSPDFASLNNVSPMAQTLREDVAGATLSSCLAGLTVPTNSAHQAELLGVIRDVVLSLLPTTIAARATLMSLPGMTEQELDKLLHDLSTIRSEKKAASRVKESLIAAAGDGDALRAFVEARAGASSSGAIQMPSVTNRTATNVHQNDGNKTWSEEDVNGFGLNPLTANTRQAQ